MRNRTMKHRTEIDLNKMSDKGRLIYIKYLLVDLASGLEDLSEQSPRYDYIQYLIEHAYQASEDLNKLIDKE